MLVGAFSCACKLLITLVNSSFVLGNQSIDLDIGKPLDKYKSINKLNLSVIDVINQSVKLNTDMLAKNQSYRFY